MDVLINLTVVIIHSIYMSYHYDVYFKLIHCYMSIISQERWKNLKISEKVLLLFLKKKKVGSE